MKEGLLKNTLIYTVGNLGSKLIIFLLVPIISFYVTKDELGTYDLVLTALNLLVPIFTIQFSSGIYRWLLDKVNDNSLNKLIFNGFLINFLSFFVFIAFIECLKFFFKLPIEIHITYLLYLTNSVYTLLQFIIRGLGLTKSFAFSGILNSILLLLFNIVFLVILKLGLNSLFYAIILANLGSILFLFYFIKEIKFSFKLFDKALIKDITSYSLPLIPNQISWWLINASDKFIILSILGASMNGIYAISTRFPTILIMLNTIFIMAWQDHTISDNENSRDKNTEVLNNYMNLQFSLAFVLIPFSEYFMIYLVDFKFYEAFKYIPLLYLSVIFSSLAGYFGAAYLKNKRTFGIFTTTIIGGVLNIIISYFLMKKMGLYASVIGSLISFLIVLILRIKQTKDILKLDFPYKKFTFYTLITLVFFLLVLYQSHFINLLMLVFGVIFFYINYKKTIKKIFNRLTKLK